MRMTQQLQQFKRQWPQWRDRTRRVRKRLSYLLLAVWMAVFCILVSPATLTLANLAAAQPVSAISLEQGKQFFDAGRYEEALAHWITAEQQYRKAADRAPEPDRGSLKTKIIQSQINQAQALKSLGNNRRALELLLALNAIVPTAPPTLEKVKILQSLGETYQAIGQLQDRTAPIPIAPQNPAQPSPPNLAPPRTAEEALAQSLDLAQQLNLPSEIAAIHLSQGLTQRSHLNRISRQSIATIDNPTWAGEPNEYLVTVENRLKQAEALRKILEASRAEFQQVQTNDLRLQADLNQIHLLVEYLPRLHQFFALALQQLAIAKNPDDATQPLLNLLADAKLQALLNHPIPRIDRPATPSARSKTINYDAIETLIQYRQFLATATGDLIRQLQQAQTHPTFTSAAPTQATIEARINLAHSLKRLPELAAALNSVNQESNQLFQAVLRSRRIPTTTASAPPALSFLRPVEHRQLADLTRTCYTTATRLLTAALQDAKTLKNDRSAATALSELADLQVDWLTTQAPKDISPAAKNQQWKQVADLSQQGLGLIQGSNRPEVAFRLNRNLARALTYQPEQRPAARAACRTTATTLTSMRNDLVNIDQDTQFAFQESIEPFYRECIQVLLPRAGEDQSTENLEEARQLLENLQLAELDNFFREACVDGTKVALDQVVDKDNPTTAVIYPILLSDREIAVIAKIPNLPELQYRSYQSTPQELTQTLEGLRSNLENASEANDPAILAASEKLYRWLIQPFESSLQAHKVDTLVFVPDDRFRNIPMGVLHHDGKYLVETYAIAVSPGLQLQLPKQQKPQRLNLLAAGLSEERLGFPQLPAVDAELDQLATFTPLPILRNQPFTSSNLRQAITTAPINVVHIATHGEFSSNKQGTFILTYDEKLNVDQLSDLLRSRLQTSLGAIDLLVLSACKTAAGDQRAALGIAGVTLRSGVRSTLASLWTANDAASADLKLAFYKALQPSPTANIATSKAKALQQAQIQLLKEQHSSSPRIWAPYVLVGDWS
jgi:CHAT domain-containing protein